MPSSEKIVSPGVFTNEVDQTFLPAAVADIGAAIIGPTVKGPAMIPTTVRSYAEFEQKFGSTFKTGSTSRSYLTSLAAKQYLKHQGSLTVVRILEGSFAHAFADVPTGISGGVGIGSTSEAFVANGRQGPSSAVSVNAYEWGTPTTSTVTFTAS